MPVKETASKSIVNDAFIDPSLSIVDIGAFAIAFFHIIFKDTWMYLDRA